MIFLSKKTTQHERDRVTMRVNKIAVSKATVLTAIELIATFGLATVNTEAQRHLDGAKDEVAPMLSAGGKVEQRVGPWRGDQPSFLFEGSS